MDEAYQNMEVVASDTSDDTTQDVVKDLGPESVPTNPTLLEDLVTYCMDLYAELSKSSYRTQKINEIEEGRRAYDLIADPNLEMWDGASNEVLPLTAITVDNLEPRLVSGLYGRNPTVLFSMEGLEDKDDMIRLIEFFFNSKLTNEVKLESKTMSIVHTLLLEGTWFGAPEYSIDEKKTKDFVFDQQGNILIDPKTKKAMVQDVDVKTFEGGKIEIIPFTDILCADNLGSIEEWEKADKIRLVRPTYAELMRRKKSLGYISDMIGPWLYDQTVDAKSSPDSQSPSEQVAGASVTGKKVIESAEFHISYPIYKKDDETWREQSDFKEEEIIVTVALSSKTIYRIVHKRDLLFSNESLIKRIRLFPEEGRSFGTSVYGKIKGMQRGASDLFNSIINGFYVAMLGGGWYEEGSGLRGKITKEPGEYVQVDDVSKVKDTVARINPNAYVGLFEVVLSLWERAGSIANPQIGRPDDKEKTATEIMVVIQEGNAKFDYQAKTTKEEYINLLRTLYNLYYQHMPYNATIRYNGKVLPIPRRIMRQGFLFSLSGSTAAANKMIERKESEDLYKIGLSNPIMNPITATEDLLKSYGKVELKRYINPQITQLIQSFLMDPQGVTGAIQQYMTIRAATEQEVKGESSAKSTSALSTFKQSTGGEGNV